MRVEGCEYGAFDVRCGAEVVGTRPRPVGTHWRVCQYHADLLDRLTANMQKHKTLLERLAEGD